MAQSEETRAKVRSWLAQQRREMPFGVLVRAGFTPRTPVGIRGAVTHARWDDEWLLYLFASEEDRDRLKGMLSEDTQAEDPAEATKVKD